MSLTYQTQKIKVGQVWVEEGNLKGVKVGKDWWMADKESGLTEHSFEKGKEYTVQFTKVVTPKAPDGRCFIKSIVEEKTGGQSPTKTPQTEPSDGNKKPTEVLHSSSQSNQPVAFGRTLSAYEIEKDKRIGVAGIVQAVAQSPSLVPFIGKQDEFSQTVEEESRKLLAVVKKLVQEP